MAHVRSTSRPTHVGGDAGFWRSPKRWTIGGALALAVVLSAACGGGDKEPAATASPASAATQPATATPTPSPTPEPNKFDTAKAAALAKSSLLKPADLGTGWAITSEDKFALDPMPSSAACAPSVAAQKAFSTALETNPAGRANVSMARQAAGDVIPASASFQVYIYSDAKAAAAPLAPYRSLYDTDDFLKCFEEMSAAPGVTMKVTKGTPSMAAPAGGVAVAYEIAVSAGSVTVTMRMETYAWSSSNALVGITLTGGKDVLTPAFVTSVVTKTQAGLAAAR